MKAPRPLVTLTVCWIAGLIASGWRPYDRLTWWLEVAPVLLALPVLWSMMGRILGGGPGRTARNPKRRVELTQLALFLVGIHGLVLMLGGAYSYARVPIGFAAQDLLGLARNPYDRFGHLMQGFVPAIVLREWLLRASGLRRGAMVQFLVMACCLAISAAYELVEFAAAMALCQGAEEFLGTQGDPWDTQWDMLMCLVGAGLALLTLSRLHDRQLAALAGRGDGARAVPGKV